MTHLVGPRDILIVDDNTMNLGVLSGILRDKGHQVRVATSGLRALDAAGRAKPDLIMLDITMPGMDGFQVCEALKADPSLRDVPVIFISALDEAMDKVKAFNLGGVDYVQKPFQAAEVLVRVEHQLKLAALQKALEARNRELEDAKTRLEELDRLKSRFTAMLVHDLRNPLGAVRMTLEMMIDDKVVHPGPLVKCQEELKKCLNYLNELLEVYRGEAKSVDLHEETLDPAVILASALATFLPSAEKLGVQLKVGWPDALPPVKGDPVRLDRVLSNLLSNALKFSQPGGSITLGADVLAGDGVDAGLRWLRIIVQDTGRGIPAVALPFIFDPYRQAVAKDSTKGSGLGLAIVSGIVAAHHGRITVQSQEGVGTCFTILLPC